MTSSTEPPGEFCPKGASGEATGHFLSLAGRSRQRPKRSGRGPIHRPSRPGAVKAWPLGRLRGAGRPLRAVAEDLGGRTEGHRPFPRARQRSQARDLTDETHFETPLAELDISALEAWITPMYRAHSAAVPGMSDVPSDLGSSHLVAHGLRNASSPGGREGTMCFKDAVDAMGAPLRHVNCQVAGRE